MNNEKKNKNKTKNNAYSTMILGFFLCFFMVGVYIVTNNISKSYALPVDIDAYDINKITTSTKMIAKNKQTGEVEYIPYNDQYDSNTYDPYFYTPGEGFFTIGEKFTGTVPVDEQSGLTYDFDMFCLEAVKGVPKTGVSYERNESSDSLIDEGIVYIINEAYKNIELKNNELTLSMEDYYNAQIAIWLYQELNKEQSEQFKQETCLATDTACEDRNITMQQLANTWNTISANHSAGAASTIWNYIVNAKNAKVSTAENAIKVTSGDIELKLTEDNNYYETGLIEVEVTTAVNTQFNGFNFVLNDQETAATVVDENGETITDYSTLANRKFKIRVPASSVKEGTTTTITGDFSGRFVKSSYLAYKVPNDNNYQVALLAASTTSTQTVPLKLEITVPDTGVDYSQYIYIIGAMVLVIGLTVIYVNTKAKEI